MEEEQTDEQWRESVEAPLWEYIFSGVYDRKDNYYPLWEIGTIKDTAENIFNEAQEVVYINGKPSFVYKNFNHWLEVKRNEFKAKNNHQ